MPYTFLDDVVLSRDPQAALQAATKQYVDGKAGGSTMAFTWTYDSSTTMGDPGSGNVRSNTAPGTPNTQLAFSKLSMDGTDVTNLFKSLVAGDLIYYQKKDDASNWARYTVAAPPTDNTSWFQIPVTVVSTTGSVAKNQEILVRFTYGAAGGGGTAEVYAQTTEPTPAIVAIWADITNPQIPGSGGGGGGLDQTAADARYVNITGDTLTGPLIGKVLELTNPGSHLIMRNPGHRSWMIFSDNNADRMIFVPSSTVDGIDWNWDVGTHIYSDGAVVVNNATFDMVQSYAMWKPMRLRVGSETYWEFGIGGGGTRFDFDRFVGGNYASTPITIYKSSGNIGFEGDLIVDKNNPKLILTSATPTERYVRFQTANKDRWTFGAVPSAETGSNAGSDFSIARWDDNGNWIDNPIGIARSSGLVYTGNDLAVYGGAYVENNLQVDQGASFGGDVDMNGRWLYDLHEPESPQDAATKNYVDNRTPKITVGTTAPSSPAVGDLWVDTN